MEKCKSNCRGRASKTTGKMGKGISEKSNLRIIGKMSLESSHLTHAEAEQP